MVDSPVEENDTDTTPTRPTPKTNAEKCRAYREKLKAKGAEAVAPPVEELSAEAEAPIAAPPEPTGPDLSRPPKRVGLETKQRWLALPEWVRREIHAREAGFDASFKKFEGMGGYAAQAEKVGMTLAQVFKTYLDMEREVRTDPVTGVGNLLTALEHDLQAVIPGFIAKYCPGLGEEIFAAGFQEGRNSGAVEQFAKDRPDFEMLRPKIEQLGKADPSASIEKLYDEARWIDPATRVLEMAKYQRSQQPRDPINRARSADKAVIGAPRSSPGNGDDRRSRDAGPDESVLDTVRRAYKESSERD